MYACVAHTCNAYRDQQRKLDPLEPGLQMVVSCWMLETKIGPLYEQKALLTTESIHKGYHWTSQDFLEIFEIGILGFLVCFCFMTESPEVPRLAFLCS